jgi:hypothetical protein
MLKSFVKKFLNDKQVVFCREYYFKFRAFFFPNNLPFLALAHGTDKEGFHSYCKFYQRHFKHIQKHKLNILEIGVGGYENPNEGGNSLRMWKSYFRKSNIFGIDIFDKSGLNEDRIKTFKGSQTDEVFLKSVVSQIGKIDIVIDDGSHINNHVIETFKILFPLINKDAVYIIEDLQTSYWTKSDGIDWGGSRDLKDPKTSMNFIKGLVDCINHKDYEDKYYIPSYLDENISSVHFYKKIAFIFKSEIYK